MPGFILPILRKNDGLLIFSPLALRFLGEKHTVEFGKMLVDEVELGV